MGACGGRESETRRASGEADSPTSPVPTEAQSSVRAAAARVDLLAAAAAGNTAAIQLVAARAPHRLAQTDPTDGSTALHKAAQHHKIDAIQALLAAGADPMAGDRAGLTALHVAAGGEGEGFAGVLTPLLEAKAELEAKGNELGVSPLWIAAGQGRAQAVGCLAEARSDPGALGHDGQAPLWVAAAHGHTETVRALLEAGARANQSSEHVGTPLWVAAKHGQLETVRILLDNGATVDKRCKGKKRTALYQAAHKGHKEVVQLLLEASADVNAPDAYGWRPIQVAKEPELKALLRQYS